MNTTEDEPQWLQDAYRKVFGNLHIKRLWTYDSAIHDKEWRAVKIKIKRLWSTF